MIGKLLYGLAFSILLPAALAAWAAALDRRLPHLPAFHLPVIGAVLIAAALGLMAAGILALRIHGGGLPMNAFPPPRLATRGAYALVPHPIYVGFVLACAGVALAAGSGAGLWIVTPVAALGCAALVWGFERQDLQRRLGAVPSPLLRLPAREQSIPNGRDVLSVYVLVLLPWAVAYETIGRAVPHGPAGYLPFEHSLPVLQWTEWVYASIYPFVLLAPILARSRADLRRFCMTGLIATAAGHLIFFVLPFTAPPRPFAADSLAGRLLLLEQSDGLDGRGAFPSFHVFWAFLCAWLYGRRGRSIALAAWAWAAAIAVSCITTGMHSLADIAAGALLFAASLRAPHIWSSSLRRAERIANSWRDWRIGPVRIINHGAYAGLGAFIGITGAGLLAGDGQAMPIAAVSLAALIGAGLWGQALVGSRTLLRPFGYYGSIIGAAIGVLVAGVLGADLWIIGASLATVAPWVQAAGRLRCLVQGCCHGAPTSPDLGIRYRHPLSRVCRIAHLDSRPIHPTPLYSIAGNVVIGKDAKFGWAAPLVLQEGVFLRITNATISVPVGVAPLPELGPGSWARQVSIIEIEA